MKHYDALTFQVLWGRAINSADQMAATLVKTAFSHVVRDNHDYACALYDPRGELLAQSNQCTPGQIGAMPIVVRDFLQQFPTQTLEPGDVLITNDPWHGSGHTPDIYVVTPAFSGNRLIGFAANSAHHIDIGGRMAAPEAREVYEEGIILPMAKLFRGGAPNDDIFRILARNVRMPDKVIGDLRAQIAANHLGIERLRQMLIDFNLETLVDLTEQIVDTTEAAMRSAIAEIPDGKYVQQVTLDEVDRRGNPLHIKVSLDVSGTDIHVDLTGTSDQIDLPINSVFNFTQAYVLFPLKCALHPHVPNNDGVARPIRTTAPEGSLLNARFPAPCMWRTTSVYYLVEAIFGALAKAIPGKVLAPSGTYPLWGAMFAGKFENGRAFVSHFNAQGGQGAMSHRDGLSTTVFPPNVANTSIEQMEHEAPMLCERKAYREGSGGAGQWRGGLGQEVVIRNVSPFPVRASIVGGRLKAGPPGVAGGQAGMAGEIRVNDGEPLVASQQISLEPNDFVRLCYPGGAGWGAPEGRQSAQKAVDLEYGFTLPD